MSEANLQKEIEEILKQLPDLLFKHSLPFLSKLYGKRIRIKADTELKEELSDKIYGLLPLIREVESISIQENQAVALSQLMEVMDRLMRSMITDIPDDQHGLDWLLERLQELTAPPSDVAYLRETSYGKCREALFALAYTVEIQQGDKLKGFLEEVDKDAEDLFAMMQMLTTQLASSYKSLGERRKRLAQSVMRKYIGIYGDLSGYFEKSIRVIVGLLEILEGKEPNYLEIKQNQKQYGLAGNAEKVKGSKYSPLVAGFDIVIRRAVAHKSYYFDPIESRVEFHDLKGRTVKLTYQEFATKTREFSALVLALRQFRLILVFTELSLFKQTVQQVAGKNEVKI